VLPPKFLDDDLKHHATDRQWEFYQAYVEHGGLNSAAKALGLNRATVQGALKLMMVRAARAGYTQLSRPLETFAVSTLTGPDGEQRAEWDKKRRPGMDPDDAFELPDPKVTTKLSTFTNGQGEVIGQWRSEKPELIAQRKLWEEFGRALAENVPAREVVPPPRQVLYGDLLAVYPVGDQHHGMAAWANECGKDWDLKISDNMLREASTHLIAQAPPCVTCLIPFLGDFFHYDSFKPVTPAHGNLLDADSRFPKMIDTGWLMVENLIEAALERHQNVHVIWETGNHDEATAAATRTFLGRLYRNNPRVTIDMSHQYWHYYEFGKVMLWTNHGDKCKPIKQTAVVAAEQPEMWGRTTYRMGMLGHEHHEERRNYPGAFVETFAVLPPEDAYAARGGYRAMQQMHALVFHRAGRLQTRHMFYPDTVEAE
jgi:hypothetical protein